MPSGHLSELFVFVWFSNDRRLAVLILFAVIVLVVVFFIIGVSWRRDVGDEVNQVKTSSGLGGMSASYQLCLANHQLAPRG